MSARRKPKRRNYDSSENEEERGEDIVPEDEVDPEEETINRTLSDAGIPPDGMSKEEKKQIFEMLQVSKAQYAQEEEMRKIADSFADEDAESTQVAPGTSSHGRKSAKKSRKEKRSSRSDSPEYGVVDEETEAGVKGHLGSEKFENEESFGEVLQLSMDSGGEDETNYENEIMDETDIKSQQSISYKHREGKSSQRPPSVTIIDEDSMDETAVANHSEAKLTQSQPISKLSQSSSKPSKSSSQLSQPGSKTINSEVSMDLTCLSNENSGKRTHRAHNITDFENRSMNETSLASTRAATSKVWDQTDVEAVSMEETLAKVTEDEDENVSTRKDEEPVRKKKRRKCMLLVSESDTENENADKSINDKLNVSLQCSLPSGGDDGDHETQDDNKVKTKVKNIEDGEDSDESVVFSGHFKGDLVEESVLHTPEKKRIALGSSEDGVIPETQDQDCSSSPVSPGSPISVGGPQDPYVGETLDPTGGPDYDMETQDLSGGSPDIFDPVAVAAKKECLSPDFQVIMCETTRDDEDELAAAEAVLEEENEDQEMEEEEGVDDRIPLMSTRSKRIINDLGPLDFGCDYKVHTLSDNEVLKIIDEFAIPKSKEFDIYDPPEDSDEEVEEKNSKDEGPKSPPVPSLINRRRLKRRLYDPCPMFAPAGVSVTNYALGISKYWEDYAICLRAAQEKCHVCLPWGAPVQAGECAKKTIDLATLATTELSDDEFEFNAESTTREMRYADRETKRVAFLAQFKQPGKASSKPAEDETLPDIFRSSPNITSSPKQAASQESDTDDEFEVVAPTKKKRGRPTGAGTGRGKGRGRQEGRLKTAKNSKKPQKNILEYLESAESDDEERAAIVSAMKTAKEELFGGRSIGAWSPAQRKKESSKSRKSFEEVNEIAMQEKEDNEEDIPTNLGQATFADDRISISSSSNRTTPAEGMLNEGPSLNQRHQNYDNNKADEDSSLGLEIPDDPLENVEEEAKNIKRKRIAKEAVSSSDEETGALRADDAPRQEGRSQGQEEAQLFQDSPERMERKKQASEQSMWDKGKNLQTYSRKGRGKGRKEKEHNQEREQDEDITDAPQEPVNMVACPLCLKEFPQTEVEIHAATCFGGNLSDTEPAQPVAGPSRKKNQTPQKRKRDEESDDEDLEMVDRVRILKRPPIRRKGKTETKEAEPPKRGKLSKKREVEEKSRKSPVVVEESEVSDVEDKDQPQRSPTPKTPAKDNEPTEECFICNLQIPQSHFEAHVIFCLDRAETEKEEKRITRPRKRKA